ncbi:MAG: D-Ala-D-Ala carboxypeptidase family metallohydrolase [Candidatus Paceibacterota bacterium]
MKILILNNTNIDISTDCEKVKQFFLPKIDNVYTFQNVNLLTTIRAYKQTQGFDKNTGQPTTVSYMGLTDSIKDYCKNLSSDYDIVVFAWNLDNNPTQGNLVITSFTETYSGMNFIQLAINQYAKQQNNIWLKLSHEQLHAYAQILRNKGYSVVDEMDDTIVGSVIVPFYKNDNPYALDGNYAHTLKNIAPYLDKLATPLYKYFKPYEVVGLKPDFVAILDKMRGECGFPFKINSGFRTVAQNASLSDAMGDSAHLSGLAVDIAITDSFKRFKFLEVAQNNGIKRIGLGKTFIHIDISSTLPTRVAWNYN